MKHDRKTAQNSIHIYELVCLLVIIASILSIILISLNHFHASYVLFCLPIAIVFAYLLYGKVDFSIKNRFGIMLFPILAVAILLRWDPYPHHVGGQDQGLYINMSSTYEKCGSLNYTDLFRNTLTDQQKILYDRNGGSIVSGVQILDETKSIQQMPFYPLHPLWMANFAKILGPHHRAYSLLFFSLLSIVGIYLLTLEISNNNRLAALLAASFAAVNPGLVFFSKFPVSEVVALAFTSNGFYFLAKGYRAIESGGKCGRYFFLSAGMFNCFFYTRMASFLYIPIFLVILFGGLIDLKNNHDRGKLLAYFGALFIFFGVSNYFYFKLIPSLFYDVTSRYIAPFGEYWKPVLSISVVSVISILVLLFYLIQKPFIYLWIRNHILRFGHIFTIFLPVAILLFLLPIYKIYVSGGIDSYSNYSFKVEAGISTIVFSVPYRIFLHLSPIGFCILLLSPIFRTIRNNKYSVILLLFISSLIAVELFKPYSPYAFYYDRYYVSEIVPYSLIVLALTLTPYFYRNARSASILSFSIVCLIIGYFAFFSFAQLGKTEGSYPDFFYEIDHQVEEGDLLLLEEDYFPRPRHVKTPLIYYLGKNVFPVKTEKDIFTPEIIDLKGRYQNTYLLSARRRNNEPSFELIKPLKYKEGFFIAGFHTWAQVPQPNLIRILLPFQHYEREWPVYIYRVNAISPRLPPITAVTFQADGNSGRYRLGGWSDQENDFVWTNGKVAELKLCVDSVNRPLRLKAKIAPFLANGLASQSVRVSINNNYIDEWSVRAPGEYSADIPSSVTDSNNCFRISFETPNAERPSKFKKGSDERLLGVAFYTLVIEPR